MIGVIVIALAMVVATVHLFVSRKPRNGMRALDLYLLYTLVVGVGVGYLFAGLGHLLMANFIKALKDLDRLPQKMIFYNNGVKLATNDSPIIEHLKSLEKMGVELLLCATCVNHYSLADVVGAGTLSNMYAIAEVMS